MNSGRINEIIDHYMEQFPMTTGPDNDELFKWKAAAIWKTTWDIDAADFGAMLKQAVIPTEVLVDSKTVYPASGLIELCNRDPALAEKVRAEFRALLQDTDDPDEEQALMESFVDHINALIDKAFPGSWKYVQDRKSVSDYLGLSRPDRDFFYKASEVKSFAEYVEFDDEIGVGQAFSLRNYYRLCGELIDVIESRRDLRELAASGLQDYALQSGQEEITVIDPAYHILAFDIIYCTGRYGFYTEHSHTGAKKSTSKKTVKKQKEPVRPEQPDPEQVRSRELQDTAAALQSERAKLQYPDLTGRTIVHKAFGSGEVIRQEDHKMQVRFAGDQIKTMNIEALYKGRHMDNLDADVLDRMKKIKDLDEKIAGVSNELKTIQMMGSGIV